MRALALVHALLVAVFELVVGFVAPPSCAACAERVQADRPFCAACATTLEPLAGDASDAIGAMAPFVYGGALRTALRAFKYGGRADLARPLGHLMRGYLRARPVVADVVVPVPLHPRRRAERGHDQTALLARHVARELGVPCDAFTLQRIAHGPAQASLTREERRLGASLKFTARNSLHGKRVLLVDDVVTTGATVEACRRVLLEAGAARVDVLAVARTLTHDDV